MKPPRLLLASASPRRRDLLAEHGYRFEVAPAAIVEVAPPHLSPGETVLLNARRKACAAARVHPDALVVGADTIVAFEGQLLGKPADFQEAWAMLSALNGTVHEVFSGVCLVLSSARKERTFIEVTRVHFHRRSAAELRAYLARIEPLDKAGAYAAQADEGMMIARVEGSYSNVIGLPMEALARELAAFGCLPDAQPEA